MIYPLQTSMKITIDGVPGSGKSTVAKEVAKALKFNLFVAGDFQRGLAKEMGLTILELAKVAENDREIDEKTDSWVRAIGEADDNFIMVGRIAFNFIPDAIKIFLDVSDDEAARRIFHDMREKEKENTSQGATYEAIRARKESENKRYKEYYNLDYNNPDNYDLVVDTTNITIKEVIKKVLDFIKERA